MARAEATVQLRNKVGLHARPASLFVQTAKKFKSKIIVRKDDKEADAKSILGVLSLGAEYGHWITIVAEGDDAEEAVQALASLVESRFGEAE
ncbi:MAG TPA: HPr family phosphocarrier protein [Candidatus Korarchaeota archaeon]|nr:HPr family phosphocarrier protein [Candidatus Korarchaeota archaeon]